MSAEETSNAGERPDIPYIEVRKAAARAAVAASKVTGRPVSPLVQQLADADPPRPRRVESGWRRSSAAGPAADLAVGPRPR